MRSFRENKTLVKISESTVFSVLWSRVSLSSYVVELIYKVTFISQWKSLLLISYLDTGTPAIIFETSSESAKSISMSGKSNDNLWSFQHYHKSFHFVFVR